MKTETPISPGFCVNPLEQCHSSICNIIRLRLSKRFFANSTLFCAPFLTYQDNPAHRLCPKDNQPLNYTEDLSRYKAHFHIETCRSRNLFHQYLIYLMRTTYRVSKYTNTGLVDLKQIKYFQHVN